jgi:hypothetical protein
LHHLANYIYVQLNKAWQVKPKTRMVDHVFKPWQVKPKTSMVDHVFKPWQVKPKTSMVDHVFEPRQVKPKTSMVDHVFRAPAGQTKDLTCRGSEHMIYHTCGERSIVHHRRQQVY